MPRETVRDAILDGQRVEVGWGAIAGDSDGYVQVATTNSNYQLVKSVEFDEKGNPQPPTDDDPLDGWWAHLDRAGINRLIRVLRRARDSAFGADA